MDFFVTDVPNDGFNVDGPQNVLEGENITLKCSASIYNFSSVEWYKDTLSGDMKLDKSNYKLRIEETSTKFSFTKKLTLINVTIGDRGNYICRGRRLQTPMTAAVISSQRRSSSSVDPSLVVPSELSFKVILDSYHTVWKFEDFSATQRFYVKSKLIIEGVSKMAILSLLAILEFRDFGNF